MKIFRSKDNGPTVPRSVEQVEVSDCTDVTGTSITFPHCDALILHSPGSCAYCDRRPDWQQLRSAQGIAFSDMSNADRTEHGLLPCPSTARRPADVRDQWPGNTASRAW